MMRLYRTGGSNFRVDVNFCDAGFRPGGRATFVSAKVAKTSDAPSGLMRGEGRKLAEGGPTRRAHTRSARYKSVPSLGQPAGVPEAARGTHGLKMALKIHRNQHSKAVLL